MIKILNACNVLCFFWFLFICITISFVGAMPGMPLNAVEPPKAQTVLPMPIVTQEPPVIPTPNISPSPVTPPSQPQPPIVPTPQITPTTVVPSPAPTPPAVQQTQGPATAQQGISAILAPEETPTTPITPQPPLPPEQPQQPEPNKTDETIAEKDQKDIYLNFENTELANFINYIAEIKKLNLIPDKAVEGNKISLTIREPLSVEGAWNVFLTVLEMAGFSIVQAGDVYKIVAKDKKGQQPLPAYINVPVNTIPDNDSNIRYVMFLTNLQVGDMKDLVQSMLSDKGSAVDVKDVNGLILTDKCLNIRSAVRVLQELDQMGTAETVTVMHLKNANAADVKTLLETIIKQPEVSPLARLLGKTAEGGTQFFPPGTRIIAEERTNSLILLGNPKPIKKIEEFIVNHIDTELKDAKSPLHVFELQYTDANQIADILNEVTQAGDTPTGQTAAKYGAIRGGVKYFKKMNFKVDKEGNRLIVSSSDNVDWKLLKQTIKDLDKPQPQVAIETLIVTVDATDIKQIGGNVRIKKPNMLGQNIGLQSAATSPKGPSLKRDSNDSPISLLGDMISQVTVSQGLSVLTFGKNNDLWGVFSALKTQTNASVLSQPFITVSNKTKATVSVGSTQRVVQEDSGGTGLKGYADATAATMLEITPQINIDGVIRMHIHTEINQFENTEATQTSERKLDTDVTVANGQVLVLGGFVKTSITENKYKTPLLGDLPLLGWFFKTQKRDIKKQYLFIFLCPTIVKPRQLPGMGLYTKMKLHNVTDSIEETIKTKKLPDPVHNWFFNAERENYSHKVIDFANARYQPTTIDIKNDPYYRTQTYRSQLIESTNQTEKKKEILPEEPVAVTSPISQQEEIQQKEAPAETTTSVNEIKDIKFESLKDTLPAISHKEEVAQEEVKIIPEPVAITELPAPTPIEQAISPKKRMHMKELIAPTIKPSEEQTINMVQPQENKSPTPQSDQELSIDLHKRNKLKDFLSNNPAIAHTNILQNKRRQMA